jgi:hypothetical protein
MRASPVRGRIVRLQSAARSGIIAHGRDGHAPSPYPDIAPMSRLILITALILAGCASPVVFTDPKTGHTAECTTANLAPLPAAKRDVNDCIAMFEHLGWTRQ